MLCIGAVVLDQQTKTTCTNLDTHGGHHGTSFVSAKDTALPNPLRLVLADLLQNCLCCAIPLDGEKSLVASCFVKAKHCFMVSEGPGTGSEAFSSSPSLSMQATSCQGRQLKETMKAAYKAMVHAAMMELIICCDGE